MSHGRRPPPEGMRRDRQRDIRRRLGRLRRRRASAGDLSPEEFVDWGRLTAELKALRRGG